MTVATAIRCSRCGGAIIKDGWSYDVSCLNCGRPLVAPRPPARRARVGRSVQGGSSYRCEKVRVRGELLRALRKECGLSRDKLADLSGVSGSGISNWERGDSSAYLDNVALVAAVLGVDVTELLEE